MNIFVVAFQLRARSIERIDLSGHFLIVGPQVADLFLERVRFEAEEMKRLEDPSRNRFVPFIACYADDHNVRSPERIAAELEIARSVCGEDLVFCNLASAHRHEGIADVVRRALS